MNGERDEAARERAELSALKRDELRNRVIEKRAKAVSSIAIIHIKASEEIQIGSEKYHAIGEVQKLSLQKMGEVYDHAYGQGVQDGAMALRRWKKLYDWVEHVSKKPNHSTEYLWDHVLRTVREISALRVMDHIGEPEE